MWNTCENIDFNANLKRFFLVYIHINPTSYRIGNLALHWLHWAKLADNPHCGSGHLRRGGRRLTVCRKNINRKFQQNEFFKYKALSIPYPPPPKWIVLQLVHPRNNRKSDKYLVCKIFNWFSDAFLLSQSCGARAALHSSESLIILGKTINC